MKQAAATIKEHHPSSLREIGFDVGALIQVECENGKLIITQREPEEVEYHAPCGKCMMVAEDCKCYGKKGRK